jgi:hypothetical protein
MEGYAVIQDLEIIQGNKRAWAFADHAGLTSRQLTLRKVFSSMIIFLVLEKVAFVSAHSTILAIIDDTSMPLAAWQHLMAEAPTELAGITHSATISRTQRKPTLKSRQFCGRALR